jgi:hypothetical protein
MKQSKKKVVDAEEGIVIIHDELAECESADPTFGGMREGARLEEIYKEIKAKLLDLYSERFRHQPPKDDTALFAELLDELNLPREKEIGRIIKIIAKKERHQPEEEDALVEAGEEFLAFE